MYVLLFILLSLLAAFLQSVTRSSDPRTPTPPLPPQKASGSPVTMPIVRNGATEVFCAKLLDEFKSI